MPTSKQARNAAAKALLSLPPRLHLLWKTVRLGIFSTKEQAAGGSVSTGGMSGGDSTGSVPALRSVNLQNF